MKLTWFGGRALRIQLGGQILAFYADDAAQPADPHEIRSGADPVADLAGLPLLTGEALENWRPRRARRLLDASDDAAPIDLWRLGETGILIDSEGENGLLVLFGPAAALGRWSDDCVILWLLATPEDAPALSDALKNVRPKLVAIGADGPPESGEKVALELAATLRHTPLQLLDMGLALEV